MVMRRRIGMTKAQREFAERMTLVIESGAKLNLRKQVRAVAEAILKEIDAKSA
jgi:hypothetical protein